MWVQHIFFFKKSVPVNWSKWIIIRTMNTSWKCDWQIKYKSSSSLQFETQGDSLGNFYNEETFVCIGKNEIILTWCERAVFYYIRFPQHKICHSCLPFLLSFLSHPRLACSVSPSHSLCGVHFPLCPPPLAFTLHSPVTSFPFPFPSLPLWRVLSIHQSCLAPCQSSPALRSLSHRSDSL